MPQTFLYAMFLLIAAAGPQAGGAAPLPEAGHLVAQANDTIPSGATIAVRAGEADDRSAALIDVISRALERQGFRVSDDGNVTLEFNITDSAVLPTSPEPTPKPDNTDVMNEASRTEETDQVKVELDRDKQAKFDAGLSVEFFLYRDGRPPIWSATIDSAPIQADEARQLARMVETAMRAFGKTEVRSFDTPN